MGIFLMNRVLRTLLITDSLMFLSSAMLGPVYALYIGGVNGTALDAGLSVGLFSLVTGIVTLLSGTYADRLKNCKYFMVFGYTIAGLGNLLFIFAGSVFMVFVIQVILGLGIGISAPSFKALYSKNLDKRKEATEWGMWESITYFAIAGGAALGGFVVYTYGFAPAFGIMASLYFASALYVSTLSYSVFEN
jgi:MFS family permease